MRLTHFETVSCCLAASCLPHT